MFTFNRALLIESAPVWLFVIAIAHSAQRPKTEVLRWTEGKPGCTFSADDDGKYRYGMWTDDLGVVIAVDADEVRKAQLRAEPLFALFVTARYRGKHSVSITPSEISLEFVNHYQTVQNAIDPDEFARKQSDAAAFVQSRSLRPANLDAEHSEATGWIFFSAKSKWLGDWKKQEQFALRIQMADRTLQFPFALPPSRGDLLLRWR